MLQDIRRIYDVYRPEILAALTLLVPALAAVFPRAPILRSIHHNLAIYILAILLCIAVLVAGRAISIIRHLANRSLTRTTHPERWRYQDILELTNSHYRLLGMSAEEFQREIPLGSYFQLRQAAGRPIKEARFLLLHPDSPHFRTRLAEVNPASKVEELVERKSELIRSLDRGLRALAPGLLKYEIRFYDAYPHWMIQFYDTKRNPCSDKSEVTELLMMINLPGKHSKYSQRYRLTISESELFFSFVEYFEQLWETAAPMCPDSTFPLMTPSPASRIQAIVFDLDGTILDSEKVKEAVFYTSVQKVGLPVDRILYSEFKGLNRTEVLSQYCQKLTNRRPTPEETRIFLESYRNEYKNHLNAVRLMPGFEAFLQRLGGRYMLHVASSAPQEEVEALLSRLGQSETFSSISGFPTSKVSAITAICKLNHLPSSAILFVGDSDEDRIVAEAASVGFCFIDHDNAGSWHPQTRVAKSFDELIGVLFDLEFDESCQINPKHSNK